MPVAHHGGRLAHGGGQTTFANRPTNVNGTYDPVPGDFTGDGFTDILWYGDGAAAGDSLWYAAGAGGFSASTAEITGSYAPFTGDFDRARGDDVFLYGPGSRPDIIWWA